MRSIQGYSFAILIAVIPFLVACKDDPSNGALLASVSVTAHSFKAAVASRYQIYDDAGDLRITLCYDDFRDIDYTDKSAIGSKTNHPQSSSTQWYWSMSFSNIFSEYYCSSPTCELKINSIWTIVSCVGNIDADMSLGDNDISLQ